MYAHRESRLRNVEALYLWKKYILDDFDNQNQGKKNCWIPTLSFWGPSWHAPINSAWWANQPVLLRWQLQRPMCDFKNSFSPAFLYIHRAKYIFSRDMFRLPHFWAKIHGVSPLDLEVLNNNLSQIFIRNGLNVSKWVTVKKPAQPQDAQ